MDGATLQQRIYRGRAIAASHIGLSCNIFRPTSAAQALNNQIATTAVAFNAANEDYRNPNLYGKPVWYADYDGTLTIPGDYIVRQSDGATWFVGAQQQLLPIVAIECDRAVTVLRQPLSSTVGTVGYGGETALATILGATAAWPASILLGGRSLQADGLPTDVKEAGWRILLPPSVPITLLASDLLTDDLGRRFAIEGAELTDLGWRLTAAEAHT